MLTEADAYRKFVVPKLQSAGWDNEPHSITKQRFFTAGRIMVRSSQATRRLGRKVGDPLRYLTIVLMILVSDFSIAVKGQDGTVVVWGYDRLGETDAPPDLSGVLAIAAGGEQSLALKNDGTIAQWGQMGSAPSSLSNVVAMASGGLHDVALLSDGSVFAWGGNAYGQATAPTDLTNAVAVAAGYAHSMALKADGTVEVWGWNYYGQTNVPAGLSGVAAIGSGENTCIAILTNGTLVTWGDGSYGQRSVPAGLSNIVAVCGGWSFTLALKADGIPYVWGENPDYSAYTIPTGLSNIVRIAACGYACEAITGDGLVFPMGCNAFNMTFPDPGITNGVDVACGLWHYMGLVRSNPAPSPAAAGLATNVPLFLVPLPLTQTAQPLRNVQLPAGASIALRASGDGAALNYQWQRNGTNLDGAITPSLLLTNLQMNQSGNYTLVVSTPFGPATTTVQLNVLPLQISAQPQRQLGFLGGTAVFNVGAVIQGPFNYQWQFNGSAIPGATTNPLVLQSLQFAESGPYSVIVSNAFGYATSSNALLSVLNMAAWGNNTYSQSSPPTILTNATAIGAGTYHSLAITASGAISAWGAGTNYTGGPPYLGQSITPSGLSNAVAIVGGQYHTLALLNDGTVAGWGAGTNVSGAVNYGQAMIPAGLSNVVGVSAGFYHSLAVKNDGTVAAWGAGTNYGASPRFGQAIVPPTLSSVVAIAAGGYHSLALKINGTVVAWGIGTNTTGGTPNYGQSIVPLGLSNVVAIAAGGYHNLALHNDGTVVAWGAGTNNTGLNFQYGQCMVPPGLSNCVAIAAGGFHSLVLKSDGTVTAWGYNASGQTNIPIALGNVIAIAASGDHNLAIVNDGTPSLIRQSFPQVVLAGRPVTISVTYVSSTALYYQWRFNGTVILDATNASLVLSNPATTASGNYDCIVSNSIGTVTNQPIALTVLRTIPAFSTSLFIPSLTGSGFWLELTNLSGHGAVTLYSSTNLTSWSPILTNPPIVGNLQFLDPSATNISFQYYRASEERVREIPPRRQC
jgi:alpha-tubulin suppressor-like RCC1 family protein